jgi:hypothetical protein
MSMGVLNSFPLTRNGKISRIRKVKNNWLKRFTNIDLIFYKTVAYSKLSYVRITYSCQARVWVKLSLLKTLIK